MRTSRPVAARARRGSAEGVAIRRSLAPYGVCDLLVQIGLWVVFGLAYEAVRGAVVHDRARAFGDSKTIIDLERRTHTFFELALQHDLPSGHAIAQAFRLSYWTDFTCPRVADTARGTYEEPRGVVVWGCATHRERAEAEIQAGDTSTTNYDAVAARSIWKTPPKVYSSTQQASIAAPASFASLTVWETRGGREVHQRTTRPDHRADGCRGGAKPGRRLRTSQARNLVRVARLHDRLTSVAGCRVERPALLGDGARRLGPCRHGHDAAATRQVVLRQPL
jgi:hypothetical protein